jgi:site-specific recombinase XerD
MTTVLCETLRQDLDGLGHRMLGDMALAGLAPGTTDGYVRSVRALGAHYELSPDCLTEQQVRDYFLYLKNDRALANGTLSVTFSGIKFFYTHTVPRDWKTLTLVRVPKPRTLPDVLAIEEVRGLIDAVRVPHFKAFFWTLYSLGLRLSEALHLQVGDIDSRRMLVHVHLGKGSKDRYVPLPERTLAVLRQHWAMHRDPLWLFPARRRQYRHELGTGPMQATSVQQAMARVVEQLNFQKTVTPHTLRHSYATHLLEAGVNLRLIQHYLGHTSLRTTMVYLHVTSLGQQRARTLIEGVMAE